MGTSWLAKERAAAAERARCDEIAKERLAAAWMKLYDRCEALREAAWDLLNHDTEENRAKLYALAEPVSGNTMEPGSDTWAAECEEFGCHDDGTGQP